MNAVERRAVRWNKRKTGTAMPCPYAWCELALGFFAGGDVGGELGGLAAGDAERIPFAGFGGGHVFGGEDDLSDVHGIVCELAVDGLHDRVRFVADHHFAAEIAFLERFERVEDVLPAGTQMAMSSSRDFGASSNSVSRLRSGF